MTFPEEKPSSVLQRLQSFGRSFFGKESDLDKPIPKHEVTQEEALYYYMEKHKKLLTNLEFLSGGRLDFLKCVNGIYRVYERIVGPTVCRGNAERVHTRGVPKVAKVRCIYMIHYV